MKTNERIRKALKENNMCLWQLADALGISEPSMTRKMRHELSEQEQNSIIELIKEGTKA